MAGGVGQLVVGLGLDAAQFTQGLSKAQVDAQRAGDALQKSFAGAATAAKTLAAGLGVGLSLSFFKDIIDSAVEARSGLLRLSQVTGDTVDNLSALSRVGKLSGTSIDQISDATVKLNKSLASGEEGSKNAQKALDALGISYDRLKAATPTEQLQLVAKALAQYEDGTGKATAATFLFGKAGADLLPFLKDLAEQQVLVGKVTAESAREADEYRRNLITLQSAGEEWKKSLATAVIPTLAEFTSQLVDGRKAFGGYISALIGITTGTNPLNTVGENLASVRGEIDDVTASLEKAKAGGKGLFDAGDGFKKLFGGDADTKALEGRLEQLNKLKTYLSAQQTREALGGTSGQVLDRFDKKPRLDIAGGSDSTDKAAKAVSDFDRIYKQLTGTLGEAQAQFDAIDGGLGKLDQAHITAAKIAGQLAAGELKLTDAQVAQIDATLKQQSAVEQATEALRRNSEWIDRATNENAHQLEGLMKTRDAYEEQTRAALLQVAQYGLSAEALDKLEVARLRDAAATLEQKAAQADLAYLDDIAKLYREQAAAILQTADAKEKLANVKQTTDQAKELNDVLKNDFGNAFAGFLDGSKSAKDAFRSFADSVISDIARITARQAAEAIFGQAGGNFGGAGSTGGLISSLVGLAGSFFGGSYSANGGVGYSNAAGISGGRAEGGPVYPGKNYLVGEKGPEVLRMGSAAGVVIPNKSTGGDTHTHINVTVQGQPGQSHDSLQQQGASIGVGIQRAMARNT